MFEALYFLYQVVAKVSRYLSSRIHSFLNVLIFKYNQVHVDHSFHLKGRVMVDNSGEIQIGHNFKGNSGRQHNPIGGDSILRLICKKGGQLKIGANVGISNSTIFCCRKIIIGDNVKIGGGCRIWDSDFHSLNSQARREKDERQEAVKNPITIGEDVLIGGSSIILKGVTIGRGSIIGAGSVVASSIPPFEIWAGNPAKFIKKSK